MIWDTTLRVLLMSCQALQTLPANRRGHIIDRLQAGNKERAVNESQSTTRMKRTSRGCGQPKWKGQVETVVNQNGKDKPRPCSTRMERTGRGRDQRDYSRDCSLGKHRSDSTSWTGYGIFRTLEYHLGLSWEEKVQ